MSLPAPISYPEPLSMIIDTHAHLHHRQFQDDGDLTVERARQAGVRAIVLVGTDSADSRRALAMAQHHPDLLWVAAGVHPHDADQWGPDEERALREEFLPHPQVVAVGEMGLDYYYKDKCDRANERRAFCAQLALALEFHLPIVIHCREAYADCLAILADQLPPSSNPTAIRGVMHCWAGDFTQAQQALHLGFLLGIGGAVTFPRSENLRAQCQALPIQSLVLETDAPYISPVPFRGQRNESARLTAVVSCLATTLDTTEDQIRRTTTTNALALYPRLAAAISPSHPPLPSPLPQT